MATKRSADHVTNVLKRRLGLREKLTDADHYLHQGVCDMPPEAESVTHYSEPEQQREALETLHLESVTL